MKYLFLISLFSISISSFAQTSYGSSGAIPPTKKKGHKNPTPAPEEKKKQPDFITGQCVVLPGGGNLIASPCPEIILTLESKKEPIHTRTDRMGQFEFSVDKGMEYKVVSGSKFYEVVQPDRKVHAGDNFEIHLKQKN